MKFRTLILINTICTLSTGFVAAFFIDGFIRATNFFLLPFFIITVLVLFASYNFSKLISDKYKGKILKWPYFILIFILLLLFLWVLFLTLTGLYDPPFEIGNNIRAFLVCPSIMGLYWVCESILPIMQIISLVSGIIITAYIHRQKTQHNTVKQTFSIRYRTLVLINIICSLSTAFVAAFFLLSLHRVLNNIFLPLLLATVLVVFAIYNFAKLFFDRYEGKILIFPYYLLIFILLLLFFWLLVLVLTDQYAELLKISCFIVPFLGHRIISRLYNLYEIIIIIQSISLISGMIITAYLHSSRQTIFLVPKNTGEINPNSE